MLKRQPCDRWESFIHLSLRDSLKTDGKASFIYVKETALRQMGKLNHSFMLIRQPHDRGESFIHLMLRDSLTTDWKALFILC